MSAECSAHLAAHAVPLSKGDPVTQVRKVKVDENNGKSMLNQMEW